MLLAALGGLVAGALAQLRGDDRRTRGMALGAFQAQRFEEAGSALAQLSWKTAADWILAARVELAQGRPESAVGALRHVTDSDPRGAEARYLEGSMELQNRHRPWAAEAALLAALKRAPKMTSARQKLFQLYYTFSMKRQCAEQFRALEAFGEPTVDDVYRACVTNRPGAERERLVTKLKEFLAADPSDRRSRLALAEELRKFNRLAEAEQALSGLARSDPIARALRVRVALEQSDLKWADALLADGAPDDRELAPMRGRLALARGDVKRAVHEFRIAHAACPDDREILFGLGKALRLAGDDAAAAPLLETAARCDTLELLIQNLVVPGATSDATALHNLGAACEACGRLPEARAWYRLALGQNPTSSPTRQALARLERQAR
jgi:tetratricopeptide (TPR) repeat protein